jgi:signal transduction histidine kinase
VDDRLNRRFPGTGLGIPIAVAIAKLHDGSIGYDSLINVGTTATLTLPATRVLGPESLDA